MVSGAREAALALTATEAWAGRGGVGDDT